MLSAVLAREVGLKRGGEAFLWWRRWYCRVLGRHVRTLIASERPCNQLSWARASSGIGSSRDRNRFRKAVQHPTANGVAAWPSERHSPNSVTPVGRSSAFVIS